MAKLVYSAISSLDGYIADENGNFEWSAPDEEVHAFVNDTERPNGTYLLGRRMYETLAVWESYDTWEDQHPVMADFAGIWRAADKVVYSTTLDGVSTARTRIERTFDPDAVRVMKAAADRDLSIGGPHLAAHAFAADLVDEITVFVNPIIVGGGNPAFPAKLRAQLELLDEHRFTAGVVYLRYRVTR
jgi:dihydrofolate reductase